MRLAIKLIFIAMWITVAVIVGALGFYIINHPELGLVETTLLLGVLIFAFLGYSAIVLIGLDG